MDNLFDYGISFIYNGNNINYIGGGFEAFARLFWSVAKVVLKLDFAYEFV